MGTPNLIKFLDQETTGDFQRIDNVWRPKHLFLPIQTQKLVKDMNHRYSLVKASEEEFKTLERAAFYLKSVRHLEFILRRAKYVRLANQLAFGQAVADFYTVYGNILRYLKIDQARGHLQPV